MYSRIILVLGIVVVPTYVQCTRENRRPLISGGNTHLYPCQHEELRSVDNDVGDNLEGNVASSYVRLADTKSSQREPWIIGFPRRIAIK